MTETEQKREALKRVYPGPKWAHRVEKMSDTQVVAIWFAMKRQNKL